MARKAKDLAAKATLAERTVTLCLAGGLNAELEALEKRLRDADGWQRTALGEQDPRRALAEQVEALRERMKESEETFRFRALPRRAYSNLMAEHPPRKDRDEAVFNADTFPQALIAACGVDPEFDGPEDVDALFEVLNEGQRIALWDAAWQVNTSTVSVPFSVAASVILQSSEQK